LKKDKNPQNIGFLSSNDNPYKFLGITKNFEHLGATDLTHSTHCFLSILHRYIFFILAFPFGSALNAIKHFLHLLSLGQFY